MFIIIKKIRCSLIYNLPYLFVIRINFKGHLKGIENDLRRIVNTNLWRVEPRLYRPCSKICHARDRYYCFKHFVELFVDSYVLPLLFVYKISERLSGVFHRSLYIHRFGRSRWRKRVLLQRLGFLILGSVQTTRQTAAFCYL